MTGNAGGDVTTTLLATLQISIGNHIMHRVPQCTYVLDPSDKSVRVSVTEACAKRPGAAASVSRRRRERRILLAGGGRRASRSHTLAASQAIEHMHTLLQ
jgi:hypothetical protein